MMVRIGVGIIIIVYIKIKVFEVGLKCYQIQNSNSYLK